MLEEEFNKWLMDNVTEKIRDKIADIQLAMVESGIALYIYHKDNKPLVKKQRDKIGWLVEAMLDAKLFDCRATKQRSIFMFEYA